MEEVHGGGQQEGRRGSHTPVDPKGSADLNFGSNLDSGSGFNEHSVSVKNKFWPAFGSNGATATRYGVRMM